MDLFLVDAYLFWQTGSLVCFQKMLGFRFFEDPFAWHIFSSKKGQGCGANRTGRFGTWGYLKF